MRRDQPEGRIHRAVVAQLRARAWPEVVWWHPPNGGVRDGLTGALLKRLGVLAGVSDLNFVFKEHFYALELKAPGGRPTEAQRDFQDRVSAAGGFCATADGLDRAIQILEMWGILRGASQ